LVVVALAFGATAWAGLTPLRPELREQVHVIPKGTWARRMAGQDIEVLPSTIALTLGVSDILVLVNNDDVPQQFGPVLMMPGQRFRMPFAVASDYQFTCTAHLSGLLTVRVQAAPPWWKLAGERVAAHWGNYVLRNPVFAKGDGNSAIGSPATGDGRG
jgi:hypothetical protein